MRSIRSAPLRSRRGAPRPTTPRTTASCTHAASSTSTATAGRSCGWIRRRRSRAPRRSRPPCRKPTPRPDPSRSARAPASCGTGSSEKSSAGSRGRRPCLRPRRRWPLEIHPEVVHADRLGRRIQCRRAGGDEHEACLMRVGDDRPSLVAGGRLRLGDRRSLCGPPLHRLLLNRSTAMSRRSGRGRYPHRTTAPEENEMPATYTFDVFSSLDGYGAASGDWAGYWGKQGPELLDHRLDLYGDEQRMVFGATTYRAFARMLASSTG